MNPSRSMSKKITKEDLREAYEGGYDDCEEGRDMDFDEWYEVQWGEEE